MFGEWALFVEKKGEKGKRGGEKKEICFLAPKGRRDQR